MPVYMFRPLNRLVGTEFEVFEVEFEEGNHVCGVVDYHSNTRHIHSRRSRETQRLLDEGGLADTGGANHGDIKSLHGEGFC